MVTHIASFEPVYGALLFLLPFLLGSFASKRFGEAATSIIGISITLAWFLFDPLPVQFFKSQEKYYDPVWKRWKTLPSAVDDCADITSGYEQQLELQLNKTIDATPEEVEEWYQKELKWWGDRQLNIVAIATVVQICALGFMFSVMLLNQYLF